MHGPVSILHPFTISKWFFKMVFMHPYYLVLSSNHYAQCQFYLNYPLKVSEQRRNGLHTKVNKMV